MASTRLEKTFTASNRKTFTISTWVKRGALTVNNTIYGAGTQDATDRDYLVFLADSGEEDKLYFNAKVSNSTVAQFYTNRRFRDLSAWYHIVLVFDTTQATDTNRMKLYVNGEQQTFQSVTYPSQNQDMNTNNTVHKIGSTVGNGQYFDGSMTHFNFIDGTAYDPSAFGETDATTGIWKPKVSPSVTYGTNGFFLKFNEGALGTDSSPNGNNFTVNGSLTPTKDTPENVFTTFNPLYGKYTSNALTYSNGNTKITQGGAGWGSSVSTLGSSIGKWYAEFKAENITTSGMLVGIVEENYQNNLHFVGNTGSIGYHQTGNLYDRSSTSAWGSSYTTGDIIGIAMDLDNGYVYFAKNGTWQNSGDPTSGATGTGGISIGGTSGSNYFYGLSINSSSYYGNANFGNGYFGTTPVASAGSNGNEAIFEFDCPNGYYALNTKNINTYG